MCLSVITIPQLLPQDWGLYVEPSLWQLNNAAQVSCLTKYSQSSYKVRKAHHNCHYKDTLQVKLKYGCNDKRKWNIWNEILYFTVVHWRKSVNSIAKHISLLFVELPLTPATHTLFLFHDFLVYPLASFPHLFLSANASASLLPFFNGVLFLLFFCLPFPHLHQPDFIKSKSQQRFQAVTTFGTLGYFPQLLSM